jgi:hypothetical protein
MVCEARKGMNSARVKNLHYSDGNLSVKGICADFCPLAETVRQQKASQKVNLLVKTDLAPRIIKQAAKKVIDPLLVFCYILPLRYHPKNIRYSARSEAATQPVPWLP